MLAKLNHIDIWRTLLQSPYIEAIVQSSSILPMQNKLLYTVRLITIVATGKSHMQYCASSMRITSIHHMMRVCMQTCTSDCIAAEKSTPSTKQKRDMEEAINASGRPLHLMNTTQVCVRTSHPLSEEYLLTSRLGQAENAICTECLFVLPEPVVGMTHILASKGLRAVICHTARPVSGGLQGQT